ncbi:dynein regulatory complex subunit 4-like [Agrilus planipennis]|uniref:Dynein regulatory complex subunit 4-like n=1 Tax=Agrilus planipennis TaxID=224129 RepID=A0A7F5R5D4_AGRPL|nr:dynein regulatory complex subunit 4-like [Agrilus planipennis]
MPPKGGKKKGVIIDGVDTTQMTREQIEVLALKIKEENEREREERNFFQLERDKLRTFWEITRTELEEARAQLR